MTPDRTIHKLLAANRSEIAIRIFRAANELGLRTVGIYSQEDRLSLHRFKADEAYQIGAGKGPVEAYLDIAGIIDLGARDKASTRIHPGYGFLSENPALARACASRGDYVHRSHAGVAGTAGRQDGRAPACGVGGRAGAARDRRACRVRAEEAKQIARKIGFPLIVKAAMGGGGRGMRVVQEEAPARRAPGRGAGRGACGVWRRLRIPRKISPARATSGSADPGRSAREHPASVGARLLGAAAAPESRGSCAGGESCAGDSRAALRRGGSALRARRNIATRGRSSFCYDVDTRKWYFIEVNPRIQVEHTVTEVVTGIDLVRAQILSGAGTQVCMSRRSRCPSRRSVPLNGAALQCRVTTEDPENHFAPDYGKLDDVSFARRIWHSARRRNGILRRAACAVLRFAAGESRPRGTLTFRRRVPAHGPRAARIPHSRREDEYSLS